MAAKDTAALYEAFEITYTHGTRVRRAGNARLNSQGSRKQRRMNNIVVEDAVLDFDDDNIQLQKWADGRIWEIWREGSDVLFSAEDGVGQVRDVYVAEIDDTLRVVR